MPRPRILHVTPWFPNKEEPLRGIFIRRHIESLTEYADNHVLWLNYETAKIARVQAENLTVVNVNVPFQNWRLIEWFFYRKLKSALQTLHAREQFTHVVFHIAYPALVHFEGLRNLLPQKIYITEHWSIYHFNFYSEKKPHRLARIFKHQIPLYVVSDALGKNIQDFCQTKVPYTIIPNCVDDQFFFQDKKRGEHFLTASFWKKPKDPLALFDAVRALQQNGMDLKLRVAGDGPLLTEMKQFIISRNLEDHITLIGQLNATELAHEMNIARGFILPSNFETFSAVCAEATSCGTPVLANDVGGIREIINSHNGYLKTKDEGWSKAIEKFMQFVYSNEDIATEATERFSKTSIGKKYFEAITRI